MNEGLFRILLVDPHEVVRRGTRALLKKLRWVEICEEVETGKEAVSRAEQLLPHAVIMDLNLPDQNGFEVLDRISRQVRSTRVLIFSTYFSDELVRQALAAGAWGYVSKSGGGSDLVEAVRSLREGCKFISNPRKGAADPPAIGPASRPGVLPQRVTPREREILILIAMGQGNKDISTMLGISVKTAETHRARIMRKLRLRSVVEMVHYAVRKHLIIITESGVAASLAKWSKGK